MLNQATSLAPDGQPWRITVLRNQHGMVATFMDWGATAVGARADERRHSARSAVGLRHASGLS